MTRLEQFKAKYGFNSGDIKYAPAGGELLKCIGSDVVFVNFVKSEESGAWTSEMRSAKIISIKDYDPATMTYTITYTLDDDPTELIDKIIPEGFSFDMTTEGMKNNMKRFIPYSLHSCVVEEEHYYKRVLGLWEDRQTLPFAVIKTLNDSKEQDQLLDYARNIVAAVRPGKEDENGEIEYLDEVFVFRIHKIRTQREGKGSTRIYLYDKDRNSYTIVHDNTKPDPEYYELCLGGEFIGDLKIIDLID